MADPSSLVSLRRALLASAIGLVLGLAACGGEDETAAPPATSPSSSTTASDAAEDDADASAAFCAEIDRLDGERPEAYVGSDEHVADIEGLLAVATDEVRPAVERYRDFLASGAVTDEPSSKDVESWPAEVQADVAAIQDDAASAC